MCVVSTGMNSDPGCAGATALEDQIELTCAAITKMAVASARARVPPGAYIAAANVPGVGPGNGSPSVDRLATSHRSTLPASSAPTAVVPSGETSTVSTLPRRPSNGEPSGAPEGSAHSRTT